MMDGQRMPTWGQSADTPCLRLSAPASASRESDGSFPLSSLNPYCGTAIERSCLRLATTKEFVMSMKIVVIGGTGLIGSRVVEKLRAHGYEGVAAAPNTGVNTLTGEGLAEVL